MCDNIDSVGNQSIFNKLIGGNTVQTNTEAHNVLIKNWKRRQKALQARPLVNPHATAIQQDKQLMAQQIWDKKYKV